MKKAITTIIVCLAIAGITIASIFLFKTSKVKSIEVVGDIQTIYFVGSTNDVNFNNADLKITYNDGSVKLAKLTDKLVSVSNFNTSVENSGIMKLSYKTHTIDVGYTVVCKGLYYLTDKSEETYNGTGVLTNNSEKMIAGINSSNQDITTSTEMIYFGENGICDYYTRTSSTATWYADNGYYNSKFYYKITGNTINVHLGENKVYNLVACVSVDGKLSLTSIQRSYVDGSNDFLKTKVTRNFLHYEMKGNRTITKDDISVYCASDIKFAKNSKFSDSNLNIYLKVVYKNDNFLKTVYVRFTEDMFTDNAFSTAVPTPSTTRAECYYNGVKFYLEYKVY